MLIYISRSKVPYHKLFILLPSKFAWASPEGMNRRMLFLSFFFSFFFLSSFHSCFISFVLLSLFCFILLPATVLGHSPYFSDPTHARPPSLVWEKKGMKKIPFLSPLYFVFEVILPPSLVLKKKEKWKKKLLLSLCIFEVIIYFSTGPCSGKKKWEKKNCFVTSVIWHSSLYSLCPFVWKKKKWTKFVLSPLFWSYSLF